MKAVDFKGRNVEIAKDQPEYNTLPAMVLPGPYGEVITCWELSPEELEEVNKTGRLYLCQLTFGKPLQPVRMQPGLDGFVDMVPDEG